MSVKSDGFIFHLLSIKVARNILKINFFFSLFVVFISEIAWQEKVRYIRIRRRGVMTDFKENDTHAGISRNHLGFIYF